MKQDDGQATLELALALPVVLIALLLIVQVGVVVRDALALAQAAREGVRVAAITADDDAATDAVRDAAGPLDESRVDIAIEPGQADRHRGDAVSVSLRYRERLTIPVISSIVDIDVPLRAAATMRAERGVPPPTPQP